jgi:hypothetical protein
VAIAVGIVAALKVAVIVAANLLVTSQDGRLMTARKSRFIAKIKTLKSRCPDWDITLTY